MISTEEIVNPQYAPADEMNRSVDMFACGKQETSQTHKKTSERRLFWQ
jgi:hypothetical protein